MELKQKQFKVCNNTFKYNDKLQQEGFFPKGTNFNKNQYEGHHFLHRAMARKDGFALQRYVVYRSLELLK